MSAAAFLADIIENADEDAPRLVFADWLDDHGDAARAELIRAQIELARGATGNRRNALEAREAELLAAHAEAWAAPLTEVVSEDYRAEITCVFRRGFVEEVQLPGEALVESGGLLFARAPILTVRLPDDEDFTALARCKHLLRLRCLDLTGSGLSSNFGPAKLFRSRYLANLTSLLACGYDDNCPLDVEGARSIIRSKYLGNLKHLDVSNNWFGTEGTVELLKAKNLASLERLELEGVGMEDEGTIAIAGTPWLAQLKELSLVANGIGERGARALLESPFLAKLEQLDLRDNRTTREEEGPEDSEPIHPTTRRGLRERFGKSVLL
jgi:uncharacterized protein (TIGR02996 family)